MRISLCVFLGVLVAVAAFGADCTVSWDAPTENEDGTPLTNLAGFNVWTAAPSTNNESGVPDADDMVKLVSTSSTSIKIEDIPKGRTYYAITAVTTRGNESELSAFAVDNNTTPSRPRGVIVVADGTNTIVITTTTVVQYPK